MSTADDTPNPDDPFEPSDDPEHLDDMSRELDDLVDFANLEREMTEAANTTPSGPYAGQSAGERKRMEPPVGRVASVVPGHFGDRLAVTEALASRGGGNVQPNRPLFVCLHGWGSNEDDLAGMMRYVAPYNDFVSLRAPLVLQEASSRGFAMQPGAYSWFHDAVPVGDDLDYDAYAAACAIDDWVTTNVDENRDVVPIGFSQGGTLAVELLRVHPQRYRAAISLSGFVAPGNVPETTPYDDILADLNIPVFYGYGELDTVLPKYMIYETIAWLEEHTWLTARGYRGLDHAVSMEEFSDLRQWLLDQDIASGII